MLAIDAVVSHLKSMSKPVTTPEEIAQVSYQDLVIICEVTKMKTKFWMSFKGICLILDWTEPFLSSSASAH